MKKVFYLMIMVAAMVACNTEMEEEITWKLDKYPDLLVVEGSITNEFKHQSIFLTTTAEYFDTSHPSGVTGATVTVNDGVNNYAFAESSIHQGLYLSDIEFSGEPLKTYTLNIELEQPMNNFASYSAVSTMPEGIDLDTILCEIYRMPDFDLPEEEDEEEIDTTILGIYYYGKEPDNPDNYYMARIFRNNEPCQTTVKEAMLFNDDYQNGGLSDYVLYVKNIEPDDNIRFNIFSIEKDYYDYIIDIQQMDQSGNAYSMSGPPANAVGNISHALGFFTATYVSEKSGIAIDMR
jgi:hypothetical protein